VLIDSGEDRPLEADRWNSAHFSLFNAVCDDHLWRWSPLATVGVFEVFRRTLWWTSRTSLVSWATARHGITPRWSTISRPSCLTE